MFMTFIYWSAIQQTPPPRSHPNHRNGINICASHSCQGVIILGMLWGWVLLHSRNTSSSAVVVVEVYVPIAVVLQNI